MFCILLFPQFRDFVILNKLLEIHSSKGFIRMRIGYKVFN